MVIEDGKGTGKKAQVDGDNRLVANAITHPLLEHINEAEGSVWSVPLAAIAPSGATWFFILQNLGQSTIAVASLVLASTVAGVFRVSKVTGTPADGADIAPGNMNLSKTTLPESVTVYGGASITGLTESYLLYPLYIPANSPFVYDDVSRIFIPPGTAVALKAPAALTVNGFLQFFTVPSEI
jgi:hypothetical protein